MVWYHIGMLDDHTRFEFPPDGVADVPLRFTPQVLRCTAAGPGGRPLTVLIDTGTDPSAIDLGLARRLGLRIGDFALGSDATSDGVPFTETMLPWLRLGDLCLRDLYLLAVDLRQAPFEVDVVLGYNVLCNLSLDIHYAERRLRLCHPDLEPPAPGETGAILPLHFFDHFPALAGAVLLAPADDAAGPRHCLELPLLTIDTGSNGALTLSADLAARAGLGRDSTSGEGHGFASGCAVRRGVAAGLRIGPFEVRDVALDAPEGGHGDLGRAGRANLGNGVLARFHRVTLDYRRALCVLAPGPDGQGGVLVWRHDLAESV